MKTRKIDRRSLRTQRAVGNALVTLMLEKRYNDITIQDILDRANIGRSTFYEHYYDKEDVLASEIERMVEHLSQQMHSSALITPSFIPALALFQHVQERKQLYQALLSGRGVEIVFKMLQDQLSARVEKQLLAKKTGEFADLEAKAIAAYVAGALLNLLQWWIETDMAWSPERLDRLFHDLVLPGIHRLLYSE